MAIYLDNAATTPISPAALAAFTRTCEQFGNPSSLHSLGLSAEQVVTRARETVAQSLGALPEEIYFTPSGTYGNNTAILGVARKCKTPGHMITTSIEHSAVLQPMQALEKQGWQVTYIAPDQTGHVSPEDVLGALRPDTALVSVMLINNELGTLQPVREIAAGLKRMGHSALLHTDAVQAYKKHPFSVRTLGVDMLSLSGHKIHAPKGIGAMYIRKGVRVEPILYGGGQENGMVSGTQPVQMIAALAAAAAEEPQYEKVVRLKNLAAEKLRALCPGIQLISQGDWGGILSVSAVGLRGETVMHALAQQGIFVSTGSACKKGKASHVLSALGLPKPVLEGVLRISFSRDNTPEDVDALIAALNDVTGRLARA